MRSFAITTVLFFVLLTSCTTEAVDPLGGEWLGTITTEGNVTTVVNESGSVWGGTAKLVEDLSIGVDAGPDEHMFGYIDSIWATAERVYVVDRQVPAVRAYDTEGHHIRDIGSPGQGPGEYQLPTAVFVTRDGRVLVQDFSQRVNVYSKDGEYLDTWYGDRSHGTDSAGMFTHDGHLYSRTLDQETIPARFGVGRVGPHGIEGEGIQFPEFNVPLRPTLRVPGAGFLVPLWPSVRRVMLPSTTVVAGAATTYRFVMAKPDGTRVIVEKKVEPLAVTSVEREWRRRNLIASARRFDPLFSWDGAELPDHHPAFTALLPDRSDRIWVLRPESVEHIAGCTENPLAQVNGAVIPCWRTVDGLDVFDEPTGKFLGEVEIPAGISLHQGFINGATIYAPIEDEAGTIMVKRYGLVLPGER